MVIFAGEDREEEFKEEADTNLDKDKTLSTSFLVALSSRSRFTLAGAEKECLHNGDFSQEDG